ncbi:MAG TPA: hypothetical protein VGN63_07845 [Flavisolibacter sp.]|jgi:hypothetical protein|nr:hypothetical protein [Flavisolibacter sp.]
MRKATDKCLLCEVNDATKKNSHILPRFISTNFLGPKGGKRQGFSLNSETPVSISESGEVISNPKKVQDSPKEDYILCDGCESYFSILETDSAPLYNQWIEKVNKGEYRIEQLHNDLSIVECITANKPLNRLFVYSMFWRVSISSHPLFNHYKLNSNLENSIKSILLKYKTIKKGDLVSKVTQHPVHIHPYSVFTAKSFKDETGNILMAYIPENPATLHVDRFAFLLFNSISDLKNKINFDFSNKYDGDLMLVVISENMWQEVFVKTPLYKLAEQVRNKIK